MMRLSSRRTDRTTHGHFQALSKKPTLSILWKDAHTRGVNGVVELRMSDLPLPGTRVKDLFPVLNNKINSKFQGDHSFREVESFLLYGTRVSLDRRLDSLIPELGPVPRFLAVMRVYPKKMPKARILIFVKTLTDSSLRLLCCTSDTVGDVKNQIQEKLKISPGFQRLVYDGKQLEDHLALSTYEITNCSRLHLVRMMNGGGSSRVFADVSDLSLLQEREFSPRAPEWRRVSKD
ncbi:hypothetical protein DVH05_021663 [Phytophthora capsici]|nr:hypothetical protein DVH05_021663 [Phytophthora capsici]